MQNLCSEKVMRKHKNHQHWKPKGNHKPLTNNFQNRSRTLIRKMTLWRELFFEAQTRPGRLRAQSGLKTPMRRDTAAPACFGLAFCDPFRHVALTDLCFSILWLIMFDLVRSCFVRFLIGLAFCVLEIRGFAKKRFERRCRN